MDHSDIRPTSLLEIHHLIFEATQCGSLRVIAMEEDPETKAKSVHEIIEYSTDTRHFAHNIVSLLAHRVLGNVASIQSAWSTPISGCLSDESRIRRIIKAFPGAAAYSADQHTLYEADRSDFVVPF